MPPVALPLAESICAPALPGPLPVATTPFPPLPLLLFAFTSLIARALGAACAEWKTLAKKMITKKKAAWVDRMEETMAQKESVNRREQEINTRSREWRQHLEKMS